MLIVSKQGSSLLFILVGLHLVISFAAFSPTCDSLGAFGQSYTLNPPPSVGLNDTNCMFHFCMHIHISKSYREIIHFTVNNSNFENATTTPDSAGRDASFELSPVRSYPVNFLKKKNHLFFRVFLSPVTCHQARIHVLSHFLLFVRQF